MKVVYENLRKYIRRKSMKKLKLILTCIVVTVLMASCSTGKQEMASSSLVPAAAGTVDVKAGDNDNTELTVIVKHLALAQKVYTGATNYIVWIKPEGSQNYQNVGALNVDSDLQGIHKTSIPYKNFKVLVTPENGNMAQLPTGPAIFEQQVMRR
jgi:hypothetical protein